MFKITLGWLLLLAMLLTACQSDDSIEAPDVSDIQVDVELRRFEQELFSLDTNRMDTALSRLEDNYPAFGSVFFDRILRSRDKRLAPQGHAAYVKGFLQHPAVRQLYDTCMVHYRDMETYRQDLNQAMRYLKYYFPDQETPRVTTFISEYSYAAFIYGENDLAIGLDFFLGSQYPYQKYNPSNPNFSQYLTRTFNRYHILLKTLQPLIEEKVGQPANDRLLDFMINEGKKLYLTERLLPFEPDTVRYEFSAEQMDWVRDNEREVWAYFLTEELLYESDYQKIRKFVEYSPHSPGMPPEAPGRTGSWLGLQIIRAYAKRNPDRSLQDLLESKDAQEILSQSRFKPRRN